MANFEHNNMSATVAVIINCLSYAHFNCCPGLERFVLLHAMCGMAWLGEMTENGMHDNEQYVIPNNELASLLRIREPGWDIRRSLRT